MKTILAWMALGTAIFISAEITTAHGATATLAWDSNSEPDVSGYRLYYGASSRNYTTTIDVGKVTTATVTGLVAGNTYFFAVTAYNTAALESGFSAEINYTIPSASPPAIALSSPPGGSTYSAPANIAITANVTLNGHTATKVQFYNGTTLLGEDTTAPYSFTLSNADAGSYSLLARLVYDAGSTLDSAVANVTVVNPSPVIALSSPANGSSYSTPASIAISANATLNGHTATKVQFYNGTALLGEDATAPYSFTWSNVSAGSYSLFARLVYDSGSTLDSAKASITVANPAPVITLSSPANGASFAAPATIAMSANVTLNGHTATKVQFYNGTTLLGENTMAPYSFTWSNVAAGSYSLTAHLLYDTSSAADSSPVNVTVSGLPLPWMTRDVGTVAATGSAGYSNNVYTVSGAGNIGGSGDAFRFAYQNLSGDGEIKAQVYSAGGSGSGGRVGVMIRETLNNDSIYAFMGITPSGTFRWQRRINTGGGTSSNNSSSGTPPNTWVRVVRAGSTLSGYKSTDGVTWTLANSRNISMASNVYVGLAVASGSSTTLNTSTFRNVSVVP